MNTSSEKQYNNKRR